MARPKRCRRVYQYPRCMSFAPEEEQAADAVVLAVEEYETIRLIDWEGLTQSQCAEKMRIARTTVTAIYEQARRKVADCLVNGRALVIAGGDYEISGPAVKLSREQKKKGEHTMRVAVAYKNGEIFQHFGRTEQFKLYDVKDGKITEKGIVEAGELGHGALAGLLKRARADILICGGIGGAQMALAEEGIQLYAGVEGSADEAVLALVEGNLEAANRATCSHHGEGHSCGHGGNHRSGGCGSGGDHGSGGCGHGSAGHGRGGRYS